MKAVAGWLGCLGLIALVLFVGYVVVEGVYQGVTHTGSTSAPKAEATITPGVIISGKDWNDFDVIIGHHYHVLEGFTGPDGESPDQWAQTLLTARIVGNHSGVETAYGMDIYRHYGNANEDSPPECKVVEQDPITIHTGEDLGQNSPEPPIQCTLDDGSDFYATDLRK